jgi:hypothetical protein
LIAYIVFLFFTIILGYFWERGDISTRWSINKFLMFSLFFLVGLKYNVGTDSINYLRVFNQIKSEPGIVVKFPEVSYYMLNNLSAWLGFGMQFIYLICGFIIAFCTINSARVLKVNPGYYLALVFPFHIVMLAVSGVRQGVAESIFIYAFALLLLGKKRLFVVFIILATTFHSSALFFITLLLIDNKKRWLFLGMLLMLPALLFFGNDAYGHYLEISLFSQGIILRVGYLLALSFFFMLYLSRCNFIKEDLVLKRLFLLCIISPFLLFALGIISTTLVDRVAYYFILMSTLLLLFMFKKLDAFKSVKVSLGLTLLVSVLGLFAFAFLGNNAPNYAYHNYLIYLLSNY